MTDRPPTYRERAIATGVKNVPGLRDLIIDLAAEIDELVSVKQTDSETDSENTETETENGE